MRETTTPAAEEAIEAALPRIASAFSSLHAALDALFDMEEKLSNALRRAVPLKRIRDMEKAQEERRKDEAREYGHLWTGVYLLRARGVSAGIPGFVASGMIAVGRMQFRKYVFIYYLSHFNRLALLTAVGSCSLRRGSRASRLSSAYPQREWILGGQDLTIFYQTQSQCHPK